MDPSERPLVDVGVVTWNNAEVAPPALRNLLDTDQGFELQLLVRDNASSDGTVEALRREVPEATVDAGSENLGFAAGVNTLLRRAEAPWFFLLNPDAWPLPGAIGTLVRTALEHPRAGVVVPKLEHPDGSLQHSTHPFPSLRIALTTAFAFHRLPRARAEELLLEGAWAHDRPRTVDWAMGAAWLLRREALEEIGGLDEGFFMYVEDLEWCWRANKHGWEIRFEPGAVVRHVGNVSGEQGYGVRRARIHVRNAYRFYRREHGLPAATAWVAVNLLGTSLRYLGARLARNQHAADRWRIELGAYLRAVGARDGTTPPLDPSVRAR